MREKMDVNALYRVTGQSGWADCWEWWKAANENISETFSANAGLRVAKGRDLAPSSGKKIASAKGWITSTYTGMITVVPQRGRNKTPFHLGLWLHSDFLVEGFVAIIMAFLRTVNAAVSTAGEIRRETVLECKLVGDYPNICNQDKTCVCTPERVWVQHWLI